MKNKIVELKKQKIRNAMLASLSTFLLPVLIVACGKSEWREVKAPNTGDAAAEIKTGDLNPSNVQPNQTAYVAPDRLRARSTPDQDPTDSTTLLERNDAVEIVDGTPIGEDQVVEVAPLSAPSITIVPDAPVPVAKRPLSEPPVLEAPKKGAPVPKTAPKAVPAKKSAPVVKPVAPAKTEKKKTVFVPLKYLNKTPVRTLLSESEADRYIMIQNIATEKVRVYKRSSVAGEPNRLVFEADMIAGENDPAKTRRTALGSYKIEKWIKFYQDNQGLFPSWLDANTSDQPAAGLPLPGAELRDWTQSYLMPKVNGQPRGLVRGAFGWYTAKIGPNALAQWTHGTVGWGADRDRFIKISKAQLADYYSDERSFGCTRLENQAIAYLQDLLPVGTRVVKIYARESLADKSLERYVDPLDNIAYESEVFDWILTKDGIRQENPNSSRRVKQLLRDVIDSSILETGSYKVDSLPTAVHFKKTVETSKGLVLVTRPEANLYDLPDTSFQGTFLVDEGRLVDYKHPRELRLGGYSDQLLPKAIVK